MSETPKASDSGNAVVKWLVQQDIALGNIEDTVRDLTDRTARQGVCIESIKKNLGELSGDVKRECEEVKNLPRVPSLVARFGNALTIGFIGLVISVAVYAKVRLDKIDTLSASVSSLEEYVAYQQARAEVLAEQSEARRYAPRAARGGGVRETTTPMLASVRTDTSAVADSAKVAVRVREIRAQLRRAPAGKQK